MIIHKLGNIGTNTAHKMTLALVGGCGTRYLYIYMLLHTKCCQFNKKIL